MASPKINTAWDFDAVFSLGGSLVASPTLAAGDAVVYTDGASTGNLNTLTSKAYGAECNASATQMNGNRVTVLFQDQTSPRAWDPFAVTVNPDTRNVDDLATTATLGTPNGASVSADIAALQSDTDNLQTRIPAALDANGFMKADVEDWKGATAPANTGDAFARLGAPVGASHSADVAAVQADTDNIQTRLPAALVSGRMDSSVGAMASGVILSASFAAGAIDSTVIGTTGAQEIADAVLATAVDGSVTLKQILQIIGAATAGKLSGAATTTITIRDVNDTRNCVVATVDASGNRSAVTYTVV